MRRSAGCAERGAERQRVERGEDRRDGDRQGELAEESPRNAADEDARNEHRRQHQPDGDNRRGNLRHGLVRRGAGVIPCSIWCSVASTTTMASSTTMPMANTSPKSESVLRLNPMTVMAAKVPMIATGTAINGISAERQFCRNTKTTMPPGARRRPTC